MRTLVHLSDVHFGRSEEIVVEQLVESVHSIQPDVVAISGDLTQRATPREFERARAFLQMLPKPQIVVPGNHDLPLYNLYARFRGGFDAYKRYVSHDLEPFYLDDEIAVTGVNTARRLLIKGGRINEAQMLRVEEHLRGLPDHIRKVVVTHHPFDLPPGYRAGELAGRSEQALGRFLVCGLDLLLAGHLHVSSRGPTAIRLGCGARTAVFVQAGTACSTRGRGEPNSYNVIRVDQASMEIQTLSLADDGFVPGASQWFERSSSGWVRNSGEIPTGAPDAGDRR